MKKLLLLFMFCLIIPTAFHKKVEANTFENIIDRETRAVWVSPLVSDIPKFTSKSQYQRAVNGILDNMEKLNLNTLIFHIRIMNDALYKSAYNKYSTYYNTDPSWEALPWIIEECHNRGIEFHAWMNPYRVTSGASYDLNELAKRFQLNNPASNPDNLIKGRSNVILNPGIPEVQNFLVNTCMEVVTKYDVDAIHFDDYFYVQDIEDSKTYYTYGTGQGIENFRRESVDNFIYNLSKQIAIHNKKNNKSVELGISPTASWANGDGIVTYDEDGKAISNGSKGITQGHYGNYLYCDTLKWVNEGWIDYILPQCYIGTSEGNILFPSVVDWWSKVCKNSRTKLYIGIGIYRASNSGDWKDTDELKKQFTTMSKYDNVSGYAYFSYRHLVGSNNYCKLNLENAKEFYKDYVLPSIINIDTNEDIILDEYYIIKENNTNKIGFTKLDGIKYYVIFREVDGNFTFLDTFNTDTYYVDNFSKSCNYYLAPVLSNNKFAKFVKISSDDVYNEINFYGLNDILITKKYVKDVNDVTMIDAPIIEGYTFKNWEKVGNNYKAIYEKNVYKVTYYVNDELYKEEYVVHGEDAPDLTFNAEYGKFSGWNGDLKNITEDKSFYATYVRDKVHINYFDYNNNIILQESYYKGDEVIITKTLDNVNDLLFVGFELDGNLVTKFIITKSVNLFPKYQGKTFKITYDLDGGTAVLVETFKDSKDVTLPVPVKDGYVFSHYTEDEKIIDKLENKDYNLKAHYKKIYTIIYDLDGGTSENLISSFTDPTQVQIPNVTKNGYTFTGFFEDGVQITKFEYKDYNLKAVWEKNSGCALSASMLFSLNILLMLFIYKKRRY